jgi:hypothetical protein
MSFRAVDRLHRYAPKSRTRYRGTDIRQYRLYYRLVTEILVPVEPEHRNSKIIYSLQLFVIHLPIIHCQVTSSSGSRDATEAE